MRAPIILSICMMYISMSGQTVQDTINEQVWKVFSQSYNNHDSQLFESIHSSDLIRVSGNGKRIYSAQDYFERARASFSRREQEGQEVNIAFRFLDRFDHGDMASEQGIYQLKVEKNDGSVEQYYGQFHVLLRRGSSKWLIFMDYDANPNNEIGLQQFLNAKP